MVNSNLTRLTLISQMDYSIFEIGLVYIDVWNGLDMTNSVAPDQRAPAGAI